MENLQTALQAVKCFGRPRQAITVVAFVVSFSVDVDINLYLFEYGS